MRQGEYFFGRNVRVKFTPVSARLNRPSKYAPQEAPIPGLFQVLLILIFYSFYHSILHELSSMLHYVLSMQQLGLPWSTRTIFKDSFPSARHCIFWRFIRENLLCPILRWNRNNGPRNSVIHRILAEIHHCFCCSFVSHCNTCRVNIL